MICEADRLRAGERDERDRRVLDQVRADLLADAGQEGEHAGRDARLVQDLDETQRDAGRLLRRLEEHRVAGDQRGGDHAGGDREREVPRRDHHADPARLVGVRVGSHPATWPTRAPRGEAERLASVVLAEVDRLAHVGVGLGDRLARLRRPRAPRARRAAPRRIAAARKRIAGAFAATGPRATPASAAAATSSARVGDRRGRRNRCGTRRDRTHPGSTDDDLAVGRDDLPVDEHGRDEARDGRRRHRRRARDGRAPSARRSSASGSLVNGAGAPGSVGEPDRAAPARRRESMLRRRTARGSSSSSSWPSAKRWRTKLSFDGVLEQPSHEVRDARHQLADRRVHAHAVTRARRAPRAPVRPCRRAAGARARRARARTAGRTRSRGRGCGGCGWRSRAGPRRRGRSGTSCTARSSRRSPPSARTPATAIPAAPATISSWSQ